MSDGVSIRWALPTDQVDLRLDPTDVALAARVATAIDIRLPTIANTVASSPDGDRHVLWLGPDEWLIVGPTGSAVTTEAAIHAAAAGAGAFVTSVDVSANRVGLDVVGRDAQALLAFGCALDLDPRRFPAGSCAQTMVARAGVVLWRLADHPEPTFRLLVRPSFATYLETWLHDALDGLG